MLPVVIPAAPGSPHLATCLASLPDDCVVYVVSEEAQGGTHVPVSNADGFAARANAGLGAAQADGHDAALLLNDDTALTPGALDALTHAVASHRLVGAVLEEWAGGVQQAGLCVSRRTGRVVARTADPGGATVDVPALSGAALAVELALWSALGGFDERFAFYFEDVDFCLRAGAAGVQPRLVGHARIRHRGGGTQRRRSVAAAGHLGRSHTLLARSIGGGALRYGTVVAAGTAWTLRSVGARGLPAFGRGVISGLRAR